MDISTWILCEYRCFYLQNDCPSMFIAHHLPMTTPNILLCLCFSKAIAYRIVKGFPPY